MSGDDGQDAPASAPVQDQAADNAGAPAAADPPADAPPAATGKPPGLTSPSAAQPPAHGGDHGSGGYGDRGGRDRGPNREHGKLFLAPVSQQTTVESLTAYASQWGEVAEAALPQGKTFAFLTFADPEHAVAFLDHKGHTIDGSQVRAAYRAFARLHVDCFSGLRVRILSTLLRACD